MTTFEKVVNIIAQNRGLNEKDLTMDTTFEQLGFDSLDTVELIMLFEEEFGLTIEVNNELKTVSDVVALIDGLLAAKNA